MTSSWLFVGDVHLNSSAPRSRIDDYLETTIEKLASVFRICRERSIPTAIFLGDIFHKNQQTFAYLYRVMEVFNAAKADGITSYAIVGNHDISYDKLDNLSKSPLGILFVSGCLQPLKILSFPIGKTAVHIRGFNYPDKLLPLHSEFSGYKICCAHRFYNSSHENSLNQDVLNYLGYDLYALGHDHPPYPVVTTENFTLIRPGALLRGTAHNFNLERSIYVDCLTVFYGDDTTEISHDNMQFDRITVDSRPPEEVFSAAVTAGSKDTTLSGLSEKISDLIASIYADSTDTSNIYTLLDQSEVTPEARSLIENYLVAYGILRS